MFIYKQYFKVKSNSSIIKTILYIMVNCIIKSMTGHENDKMLHLLCIKKEKFHNMSESFHSHCI